MALGFESICRNGGGGFCWYEETDVRRVVGQFNEQHSRSDRNETVVA